MAEETAKKPAEEKEVYGQVYIRIGRGDATEGLTLKPEMVELITKALIDLTNKGDMVVTPLGHSDKGREQAGTINKLVNLFKEKAD